LGKFTSLGLVGLRCQMLTKCSLTFIFEACTHLDNIDLIPVTGPCDEVPMTVACQDSFPETLPSFVIGHVSYASPNLDP
jgi:hypothetical protein